MYFIVNTEHDYFYMLRDIKRFIQMTDTMKKLHYNSY